MKKEQSFRESKPDESSDDRNSALSFDCKPTFNHGSYNNTPKNTKQLLPKPEFRQKLNEDLRPESNYMLKGQIQGQGLRT